MNAAIFTKSAKGLILASGLIAASSIMGYAQDAPVALGALATVPLSGAYAGAPSGITSLGGHTFDLTAGNLVSLSNGQSVSLSGSWANATGAYLLLNSANTSIAWYDQTVVGNVTLTFSDGTTKSTDLVAGLNIREWRVGAGSAYVINITDANAAQVWSGTALDGSAAVIDMLTIGLDGTKTLTSVTVNDTNGWGSLAISLAGLTISTPDPAPAPQPQPTCTRPGNSCNTPAAENSNSQKWQPSTSATTPSATTDSKHANNGHHAK